MIPAYGPEPFQNIDLRKYHVRDLKDVIRFIEFSLTRLDESKHIITKFNTRYGTLDAVVKQMKQQQQKINDLYGAPSANTVDQKPVEDTKKAVIQESHEDISLQKEREELLDDLRSAQSEEELAKKIEESGDAEETVRAEYEKYKVSRRAGDGRLMFYREGKMVSSKDIPEDIKAILLDSLDNA